MRMLALGLCGLATACFGPSLTPFECGADGLCPSGLVCDVPNDVCVAPGEGAVDAAPPIDAVVERDSDDDGVLDSTDNCPMKPNARQDDEDGDDVGDVCDNCPGTPNTDQANTGEQGAGADELGDACDPRPSSPGDSILFFDGFNGDLDDWEVVRGDMSWAVSNGKLSQSSAAPGFRGLIWQGMPVADATIATRATATELSPSTADNVRSVGLIGQYDPNAGGQGRGYLCTHYYDPSDGAASTVLILGAMLNIVNTLSELGTDPLTVDDPFEIALDVSGEGEEQRCRSTTSAPTSAATPGNDTRFTSGAIGLRTNGAAAEFDYALIIGLGGPLE